MKAKLIGIALVGFTAAAVSLYPVVKGASAVQVAPPVERLPGQKIEVVFVLDTTSSMSGLIEAAKEKIWSIATTLAQAEQTPTIEMGLVAYRDRGDEYVTKIVDLSTDLDSMYATLMQFAAVGGGDGPESVNRALYDAVHRISWSRDPAAYQVVFLVGDAPPHMDYQGEAQYPEIVRAAAARGIVVNAIQCGQWQETVAYWNEIARLGNGRYMQVGQAGDAFAVTTPYDREIAELSAELDRTRLYYGSEKERAELDDKVAATEAALGVASPAAQARRGLFNATASGATNLFGDRDLVADVESGRIELEDVPAAHMPAPLRTLAPEAQAAEVAALAGRRDELRQRIRELSDSRSSYIEEKVVEAEGAVDSLDRLIYEAVREQGAAKGLTYEGGPEF